MSPSALQITDAREHDAASAHAAALHATLLPTSPAARLGEPFLRSVYYGCLVRAELASAFVAYVDGVPAGFIIATDRPAGFMAAGLRRRPWSVSWALLRAVAAKPARLGDLVYTARLNATRQGGDPPQMGELLSFGVAEQFRRPQFVRASGIRVGAALLDTALAQLRARGSRRVRAIVDADNLAAQLFYRGAGWQLGNPTVPGWNVPTCEFVTEL
jgi:ribosomal protein S18 acetylase RimI-like enzyme